jgi:flagellar biosynthetic protein FliR
MLGALPSADAFAVLVIFARIGLAIAVLPGFSAAYVPMRMRLLIALALSILVTPALAGTLPAMPDMPAALALLLVRESAIGLFLGSIGRIVFAALQTAGTFTAYLSSFTSSLVQDPVADQQSSTIAGFFTALGLVLVFVTDVHHLMLRAIVDSYGLFVPGAPPPMDDICNFIVRTAADSFALGVQLAAPFLIVNLVYNVGLGLLGRLMPQLPVFFFGLPLQVGLQLWVMMITVSGLMLVFLNRFAGALVGGVGG